MCAYCSKKRAYCHRDEFLVKYLAKFSPIMTQGFTQSTHELPQCTQGMIIDKGNNIREHEYLWVNSQLVVLLHNNIRTQRNKRHLYLMSLNLQISKIRAQLTTLTVKWINQPTVAKTAKRLPLMPFPNNCSYFPPIWTKKNIQHVLNLCLF